ncbi:hypothetical protein, partial [Bacillus cereus group sp. BfR-BA-01381]|uniref:hypothetical protein n=1 Tax=Bacillus cereus group sp. BfR-BA-01381 TaxID=2920325 RepID=UPI001F5684FB
FCMFRFVSNKKCQPFKNTWHGLRAGEDGGSKNISVIIEIYRPQLQIYQRLLEYIDLPTITEEGVPAYWHTLFIHND